MSPPRWSRQLCAVAFDFDGTLAATEIDFAALRQGLADLIRHYGAWSDSLQGQYLLEMTAAAAARLEPDEAAHLREAAERLFRAAEQEAAAQAGLCPGADAALARLRAAGLKVAIITRNHRAAVTALLARHPLPHEALLTRDDVAAVKPSPQHLQAALHALGAAPQHALMVGDHHMDVSCGKAAGAWAAGVAWGTTTREQFLEAGADLVVDSIVALPGALGF